AARLGGARPATRLPPAALVRAAAWAGAPATAVLGMRYALARGRGKEAVPVGTALLGSVLGLAALCGTAVFGASLAVLIATPALYGAPFSTQFSYQDNGNSTTLTTGLLPSLRRDPAISQITVTTLVELTVNRHQVRALAVNAVRGRPLLSVVDGRPPHGAGQIMLGAATMRATGAPTGGRVAVTAPGPGARPGGNASFLVTGRASFSPGFSTGGLGTGAVLTFSGLARAQCGPPPGRPGCVSRARSGTIYSVLVRPAAGPAGAAALARFTQRYHSFVEPRQKPTDLTDFGESVNFPLLFSSLLSLFAAATMVHLLLVSVTRRRTEAGLLKVLGFLRRQVAAVVGWQATTIALAGIAAGVPLGIAAGKAAWRLFATSIGVVPVAVVPAWTLVLLAAAVLAAANVLAVLPALIAARSRPAQLLRAD
ncbi:MAG: FtsX-like permease family protein, partial [Streptosporangiaceae bacterium]